MPRMTDRVYLGDDGRSGYHTCGPTPLPAVIDRYFVKRVHALDAAINFCRAMLCKRGLCRHAVSDCPSVHLSVTFVNSVKTNKRIFKLLSLSGSQTVLVFAYRTSWQYSNGDPITQASNAGGACDSHPISGSVAASRVL